MRADTASPHCRLFASPPLVTLADHKGPSGAEAPLVAYSG